MGAQHSVELVTEYGSETTALNLQEDTQLIKEIDNDLYGEARVVQCNENRNQLLIVKSKIFQDKDEQKKWIDSLQTSLQLKSNYLISLQYVFQSKQKDYCSQFLKLHSVFSFYNKTLFHELIERVENEIYFSQNEILRLLYDVNRGLLLLRDNNKHHSMIKPHTIAIKEEQESYQVNHYSLQANNKYLILDSQSLFNEKSSFSQALLGETKDCYLSLKLLGQVKNRQFSDSSNISDDIFSLGMIGVEMASLKSASKLYDFDYFSINKTRLMSRLNSISCKYSTDLAYILARMLSFNENDRANPQELLNLVNKTAKMSKKDMNKQLFSSQMILPNYFSLKTSVNISNQQKEKIYNEKLLCDLQQSQKESILRHQNQENMQNSLLNSNSNQSFTEIDFNVSKHFSNASSLLNQLNQQHTFGKDCNQTPKEEQQFHKHKQNKKQSSECLNNMRFLTQQNPSSKINLNRYSNRNCRSKSPIEQQNQKDIEFFKQETSTKLNTQSYHSHSLTPKSYHKNTKDVQVSEWSPFSTINLNNLNYDNSILQQQQQKQQLSFHSLSSESNSEENLNVNNYINQSYEGNNKSFNILNQILETPNTTKIIKSSMNNESYQKIDFKITKLNSIAPPLPQFQSDDKNNTISSELSFDKLKYSRPLNLPQFQCLSEKFQLRESPIIITQQDKLSYQSIQNLDDKYLNSPITNLQKYNSEINQTESLQNKNYQLLDSISDTKTSKINSIKTSLGFEKQQMNHKNNQSTLQNSNQSKLGYNTSQYHSTRNNYESFFKNQSNSNKNTNQSFQSINSSLSVNEQLFCNTPNSRYAKQNFIFNHPTQFSLTKKVKNAMNSSLLDDNVSASGAQTPRKALGGNRNVYNMYSKSPQQKQVNFKIKQPDSFAKNQQYLLNQSLSPS